MLLRRLEAYGFKSFADKTQVEFGPGITAIVGPNGSGKSNISDAIRWVLGEQNIRLLRGAKTEDVIFSGSTNRRSLGIAEVSLVFDNSDGVLPLAFNEITITRRAFRSGESEYFINKAQCRLKDIHELLADTGLGREAMPVIGQNKVDEILNGKPEERRLIFEEAAGITKYKTRKKEALRKLQDTEQNVVRVTDILEEISEQLEPLAESAARTERYNELAAHLKRCKISLLMDRLLRAQARLTGAGQQAAALQEQEVSLQTEVILKETETERLIAANTDLERELAVVDSLLQELQTAKERSEGRLAVLAERREQEQRNQSRVTEQLTQTMAQQTDIEAHIAASCQETAAQEQQVVAVQAVEADLRRCYSERQAELDSLNEQIESGKETTFEYLQELLGERNRISTLERECLRFAERQRGFSREREQYEEQLAVQQEADRQATAMTREIEQGFTSLVQAVQAVEQQQEATAQELLGCEQEAGKLRQELHTLTPRLQTLTAMQEEYEGFSRAIKSVLQTKAPWRSGIHGAVAQVLHVPEQYITAVEIALGGALQHVLVDHEETAKKAIQFLKTQQLGRATFLPLSTIRPSKRRDSELRAAAAAGAVGIAADVVTCKDEYRPVIEFLLGRTIIANTIDDALRIAKAQSFGVRIVTLDGQQVNPGGSMTGGSVQRKGHSYLSRGNEIERLQVLLADHRRQLSIWEEKVVAVQTAADELALQLVEKKAAIQLLEVRQAEVSIQKANIAQQVQRIEKEIQALSLEEETCQQDKVTVEQQLLAARQQVTVLEQRDVVYKEQLAVWQQKAKERQGEKEQLQEQLTEQKIMVNTLQQQLQAVKRQRAEYQRQLGVLAEQRAGYERELTEFNAHMQTAQQEILALETELAALVQRLAGQTQKKHRVYQQKMQVLGELQGVEKAIKELRKRHGECQTALHELQLAVAQHEYECSACTAQLAEQFALTPAEAKPLYQPAETDLLAEQVQQLERQISELGPVNQQAIAEYAQRRERHAFLSTQLTDLREAQQYLQTIIHDMDKNMSKQFSAAFRQINEHFGDLFAKLFGGGKAQLVMLSPDNLLETGIDIIVQPPGKKQQNLILLSGGERALTVIALLFAFLAYRPSPFIMVDEIDAPLDEANLQRFSTFLSEYARNTQFIVVTHRKGTMEVADVMHGVTMEEAGVSRVVSVKFMNQAG